MTPTTDNPLVSMIVVCYNQARWVLETLESVSAQTYKHTELIIVDDCSTDGSVALIDRWLQETRLPCNFIRHEKNMGVCRSVNDAVRAASGKYISMIASDDLWLPDKIRAQVEIMEGQPDEVGVVYSDAFQIDGSGLPLPEMFVASHRKMPEMPQGHILGTLLEGNFVPGMTTLIRRGCYDTVGLYDEGLQWEDWDMWMRIARHYQFLCLASPCAKYRAHEQSLSRRDRGRMVRDSLSVCEKQYRARDLSRVQKAQIERTMFRAALELYRLNDVQASEALLALWQATRNPRAFMMYASLKLGISSGVWAGTPRERIAWTIRNCVWHPILDATRSVRYPLGLSRTHRGTFLRRR